MQPYSTSMKMIVKYVLLFSAIICSAESQNARVGEPVELDGDVPVFPESYIELELPENLPFGYQLNIPNATHQNASDDRHIQYHLTDLDEITRRDFEIDYDYGLYVAVPLDYEVTYEYHLRLSAFYDHLYESSHIDITIKVTDLNDNKPVIKIDTLTHSSGAQVMENSYYAHLARVYVSDGDHGTNGVVSCSIDNPDFRFQYQDPKNNKYAAEYKVYTYDQFDREEAPVVTARIHCSDRGSPSLSSSAELILFVLDENDNSPVFTQNNYSVEIMENNQIGDILIEVSATDADAGVNGQVTYAIADEGNLIASIDPISGLVTAKVVFDRKIKSDYMVRILAKDQGEDWRGTLATVQISVVKYSV